jgi:hypothetical protein
MDKALERELRLLYEAQKTVAITTVTTLMFVKIRRIYKNTINVEVKAIASGMLRKIQTPPKKMKLCVIRKEAILSIAY